jgi:hypothetical protein
MVHLTTTILPFSLAFTIAGGSLLPDQIRMSVSSNQSEPTGSGCPAHTVLATANYTGTRHTGGTTVRLRITNGGGEHIFRFLEIRTIYVLFTAGQSGLVGALASAFIDWSRDNGTASEDYLISWITGDTTDSINYLESGEADIAITYNAAAEYRAGNLSISTKRVYGFRDHFYLVGPP